MRGVALLYSFCLRFEESNSKTFLFFFAHLIKNAILNMPAGINDCNSFPQRYAGILLKLQLNGKMQVYVSVSHAKTGRMFWDMPEKDAEAVPGQLLDVVMMTLYIAA